MAQTQVILLERIAKLGNMGDVITVKPGYARNYLLPQRKALRASKENIAYFEAQRKHLESESEKGKKEAEKIAKKLEGLKVALIRQASEGGQLFGSVSARDIATEIANTTGEKVDRSMVHLNQSYKMIGLFPVDVALHPEVSVKVTINIARSEEEAKTQAKTGKALIAEEAGTPKQEEAEAAEEQLAEVLDAEGLEGVEKKKSKGRKAEAAEESAGEEAEEAKSSKAKAKKTEAEDSDEESETKGKKKLAKKSAKKAKDEE